jgi:glutamyl-tRNA synthetase
VRNRGGALVWRLEDIDLPRNLPGMADRQRENLAWLGLDWDEGPDMGGPYAPYTQSERFDLYEEALHRLAAAGRLFPCRRSRKDLLSVGSAPHGAEGLPPYPAAFRPVALEPGWYEHLCGMASPDAAVRFQVDERPVTFVDRVQGPQTERVDLEVGDFVLKRRDGLYAYQLAVVVDDLLMEIDEVVRGADLLASTARQIQLLEALGGTPPAYAHVPLIVNARGEKLSKRDQGLTLESLRAAGIPADALTGYLAASLGLLDRPEPCRPRDLVERFAWGRIRRDDWVLPDDLAGELRSGRRW